MKMPIKNVINCHTGAVIADKSEANGPKPHRLWRKSYWAIDKQDDYPLQIAHIMRDHT
jgi:hypothetical protein